MNKIHKLAGFAVRDHLFTWINGTPNGEHTSMAIISDGNPYKIADNLVFSFPVTC